MPHYPWKHVWITGASSGIGKELAVALSSAGVKVSVSARSKGDLHLLERDNKMISAYPADVTNPDDVERAIKEMENAHGPVDLALLNAGVWEISDAAELALDPFRRAVEVNYLGVTNALVPLVAAMRRRGGGQIGVVASVAGYRGLPKSAYYGPTKAALINLCESLQPDLQRHNIKLQVINPGFVQTPMTERNDFPMPFLIRTDRAVGHILNGLTRRRFEIAFPWQLVTMLKVARLLPYQLYLWLIARFVVRA